MKLFRTSAIAPVAVVRNTLCMETNLPALNASEAATLAKIVKAGPVGALVCTLNLRHLGRLSRRGLISSATETTYNVGARVRA